MAEYIEREKLLRDIEHYHLSDGKFQHWVEIQLAADVEPVHHGHWIVKQTALGKSYTICSSCGYDSVVVIDGHFSYLDLTGAPRCPNCGAKMDEVIE